MDEKYQRLKEIVESKLKGASLAHDMGHVMRVYELCLYLAESEPTADLNVLKTATLLHDIARMRESREVDHALLGAEMAEKILKDLAYPEEEIQRVKHCIIAHRFKGEKKPETMEAQILSDADKLDALGAIGIARCFVLAGEYLEKIYSDAPIEEYVKQNLTGGRCGGRIKDLSKHAPNIEFETKLKRIPRRLYTLRAREIGRERLAFMEQFFQRLEKEIKGRSWIQPGSFSPAES